MDCAGYVSHVRLDDGSVVLVDPVDLPHVRRFTWRAVAVAGRTLVVALESLIPTTQSPWFLPRFIAGALPNERVVTLNGDARDCRRSNLAILSARELELLEPALQQTAI